MNRGINATTYTKMKELLRFIPFFAEFYCLFFLGGHYFSNFVLLHRPSANKRATNIEFAVEICYNEMGAAYLHESRRRDEYENKTGND